MRLSRQSRLNLFYHNQTRVKFNNLLCGGFTLLELMVTVAIIGIITTIAIPSFSAFLIKNRVDNQISELHRLILTAKNTAINEGQNVTICPLNGTVCSGVNNWNGVIGVVSPDGVVKEKSALTSGDRLLFSATDLTYNARGNATINGNTPSGTALFRYCPMQNSFARGIQITISGRSYISRDSNNDGSDQLRDGTNINC